MSLTNVPLVQLLEIHLLGANPSPFTEESTWKMKVEVLDRIRDCISIRFVWVGSAKTDQCDQILDEFDVGPFPIGTAEFTLQCGAPQINLIPIDELLNVTGLLIIFSYRGAPFLRIGYYVQVAYFDENLNAFPPNPAQVQHLGKCISMSQPTVTTIPVAWDEEASGEE